MSGHKSDSVYGQMSMLFRVPSQTIKGWFCGMVGHKSDSVGGGCHCCLEYPPRPSKAGSAEWGI